MFEFKKCYPFEVIVNCFLWMHGRKLKGEERKFIVKDFHNTVIYSIVLAAFHLLYIRAVE